MYFVNAQLGRILLLLAIAWTVICLLPGGRQDSGPAHPDDTPRPVHVELDTAELQQQSSEVFFSPNPVAYYIGSERCLFVPEKKVKEFEAVDLDIPPASVMRPPQLLPDPGPSLEGSHKLPRFNEMWTAAKPAAAPVIAPKKTEP